MKRFLSICSLLFLFVCGVAAQEGVKTTASSAPATNRFEAERQLAKLTIDAHGGDKLRAMKTLSVIGSVDVTASNFPQPIPATFVMIFAGDRYRVEIKNPLQPFKQTFDGTRTMSSVQNGFTLPPFNRLGFPLLNRIGEPGFVVTAVAEGKSKKRGFRVTSPEGFFTDFYIDEKTNQIKGYDSSYQINGRDVTTAVEIDRSKLVDGVLVPEKYVQRFDVGGLTLYGAFTAKQIQVNPPVADDVFSIDN